MAQIKILKDMAGSGNLELGQGPFVFAAGQITHVHDAIAKQWEADGHAEILKIDAALPVVEVDLNNNVFRSSDRDDLGNPLHRHASESDVRDALNRPIAGNPDIVSTPPFNRHDTRDEQGNLVHPSGIRDASGRLIEETDTVHTGIFESTGHVESGVDTRPNPLNPPSQTVQMNPSLENTATPVTRPVPANPVVVNPTLVDHSKDKP